MAGCVGFLLPWSVREKEEAAVVCEGSLTLAHKRDDYLMLQERLQMLFNLQPPNNNLQSDECVGITESDFLSAVVAIPR